MIQTQVFSTNTTDLNFSVRWNWFNLKVGLLSCNNFFLDHVLKIRYLNLKTGGKMTPRANEKQITVSLSIELLGRLDSLAEHANISRHKLIVNLLNVGIDEIELLKHVGILQLAILIRDMTDSMARMNRIGKEDENPSEMPIPVRLDVKLVERLDRLAKRGDLTRHHLAKNIIKTGVEELEAARKYGLTHLVLKMRDMHDLFKNVLQIGEKAFYAGKEVNQNEESIGN